MLYHTRIVVLTAVLMFIAVECRSYHSRVRKLERNVYSLTEEVEEIKRENVEIRQLLMNITQFQGNTTNKTSLNQTETNNTTVHNSTHHSCGGNNTHHIETVQIGRNRLSPDYSSKVLFNVSYPSYEMDPNDPAINTTFTYWNYFSNSEGFSPIKGTTSTANTSATISFIEVQPEVDSAVLFVFGTYSTYYALRLNNSNNDSQNVNLTLPQIYFVPEEIIYQPNMNTTVRIVVSNDSTFSGDFSLSSSYVYDKGSMSFVKDWQPPINPMVDSSESCGKDKTVTTLNWSNVSANFSGVLTFKLKRMFNDTAFVTDADVYKSVVFRSQNQTGPFPDHVFEFHNGFHETEVAPGKLIHLCKRRQPCVVACTAVGSNVTDMRLLNKQGVLTEETIINPNYISVISANISTTRFTRITCEATNQNGVFIRRQILIQLISRPTMPRLKVYFDKQANSLIVQCKSKGVPKPEMTIRVNYYREDIHLFENDFESMSNSTKQAWVRTHVRIPSYQPKDRPVTVRCHAQNSEGLRQAVINASSLNKLSTSE